MSSEDSREKIIAFHGWQAAAFTAIRPLFPKLGKPVHDFLQRRNPTTVDPGAKDQLRSYERKTFSQQGEDGVLQEILYRIGPGDKSFVEIGVEDGSQCNTRLLVSRYRWGGLYVEASPEDCVKLRERWAHRNDVSVAHSFVTAENVADTFASNGVPKEFDLLSIDIDGNDYWIWKALCDYRPRVVVIEYNAAYPPPRKWVMAYDPNHRWDGSTHLGASLSALQNLGNQRGYALLGTDSHGLNAFFLRRDLLAASGFLEATDAEAYNPPGYGLLRIRWPYRDGPSVEG